eukprot:287048_1
MAQPLTDITSYELYNKLQNAWNVIIIDIRSYEAWNKCHIVNSINIPCHINLSNNQLVELLQTNQNKKSKIPMGMLYYIISDRNNDYTQFITSLQTLTHQHIHNKIPFYQLNISFQQWHKKYSFLCVPDMLDSNSKSNNGISVIVPDEIKEQKQNENENIFNKLMNIITRKIVIYRKYPACIIENKLYLGSVNHAAMVEAIEGLNIGYIVNVTDHERCYFENDVQYFRIGIDDQENVNIKQYFEAVFEFMDNGIQCNKAVLVHCSAGISRSATIVIGWLMKNKNMTFIMARDYVLRRREVINPNKGFTAQLKLFEAELFPELNDQINDSTKNNNNDTGCIIL